MSRLIFHCSETYHLRRCLQSNLTELTVSPYWDPKLNILREYDRISELAIFVPSMDQNVQLSHGNFAPCLLTTRGTCGAVPVFEGRSQDITALQMPGHTF